MATDNPERRRPAGCPFSQWREDFPIRWDEDDYVTRRELTRFLVLGSGLLAGANAAIAIAARSYREGRLIEKRIGSLNDVPHGGSVLFRYPTDEDPCILVRDEKGELRAYSQVCTHLSCAVIHRAEKDDLFCPCHHGVFSVEDGRPLAGPPTRQLPRIRLEVRGNEIFAVGVEV